MVITSNTTLFMGSTDSTNIKILQRRLQQLGYYKGYLIDGRFLQYTFAAVKSYQHSRRLVEDGIAGPITLKSLGLVTGLSSTPLPPVVKPALTPDVLNNKNFSVTFNPLRNTSVNAGVMSVDYIDLIVDYTDPTYSLVASMITPSKLGNNVTYTLTLKNTNNCHQGHSIYVSISVPSGLTYVSNNGSYDNNTHKWRAVLNNAGVASIKITFRATTPGNKIINAKVDGFTTSLNKSVYVQGAYYTLSSTLPRSVTQGHDIPYNITVKSDSTLIETIEVNVPIPDGFAYVSSDPSYNEASQVWTATFNNEQTDTLALTLEAVIPGTYTQTITATNAYTVYQVITIIPSDIGDCNYVEIPLPDDLKVYMQDGVEYFVSCEMELVSELSGAVYDGYNNFSIALSIGDDEEEKEEGYEIVGTLPDTLNIYERVFTQFVYDQNATTTIRIYGQYDGLEPGLYNVRFGKWSISNLSSDFEESGGLVNDPSCLCEDGNYATLLLDGGESSKSIILGNFNLSGIESTPDLIIKGIGVQLDYICNTPSTLNVTLTSNGQVSTQSTILDPALSTIELGGEDDKWDILDIDLANVQISYTIINTSLNPTSLQLKNIQLNSYSTPDRTNGNMGFILNGEHSRNYDIFLSNDGSKNEGTLPSITTYDLSNSEGELIAQLDLKAKKMTIKFTISGPSLIDAQNALTDATKYLSNDLNPNNGLPIPNVMVFDWDPDREYNVVLSDEIKVTLDTFTYSCEADFTIPEGLGWNNLKLSGAIGTNGGIIEVRPLITLLTTGGNVQIFDNITYKSLTINNNFDTDVTLIINCAARTIIGDDGNDYTNNISLNSIWPVIMNDFDLSESTGCLIQSVSFREGM